MLLVVFVVPDLLELFQVFDAHVVVACLADRLQILQRRLTARGGRLDMTALEGVVADRPNAYVALTFNHVAVAFQPDLLAQRLRHAGVVVRPVFVHLPKRRYLPETSLAFFERNLLV